MTAATKLRTDRQRVILDLLNSDYQTYKSREQHHYVLNGMSTSHIALHALKEPGVLLEFWPANRFDRNGNIYDLARTIERTQDAIRDSLKQLVTLGYVEKMGNEHERRWRPTKDGLALAQPTQ